MTYVLNTDSLLFLKRINSGTVDLILTDPPFYGIVKDTWDNSWKSANEYSDWMATIVKECLRILKPHGSLVLFQGIGKHGEHPIFRTIVDAEKLGFCFRNWITWKKRRAYGKSHDYLFCREEILWFSKSHERTEVIYNIPLLSEKRGYKGWNEKYPAKSEFKRVSNVWDDIPEIFQPQRSCQKPEPLMQRLVETHSNRDSLVVDPFIGYGTTGMVALQLGRKFLGCEGIPEDAAAAEMRCQEKVNQHVGNQAIVKGALLVGS